MTTVGGSTGLALAQSSLGVRATPYRNCHFMVEVEGLILGGFTEVTGLESETEVETIREGGVNYKEYKLVGQTTFSDITLRNGLAEYNVLLPWYQTVVDGDIERRNGTIYMLNQMSIPVMWWDFINAWPRAWRGPEFNANNPAVAVQELIFVHEGLSEPYSSQIAAAANGAASVTGQL